MFTKQNELTTLTERPKKLRHSLQPNNEKKIYRTSNIFTILFLEKFNHRKKLYYLAK